MVGNRKREGAAKCAADAIYGGAVAATLKQVFPDYIGFLEFGGRTEGRIGPTSDFDLVVVVENPRAPCRLHFPRVDFNIVSLASLTSLESRILTNAEKPWDGMFAGARIIDTCNEEFRSLIERIQDNFSAPRSFSAAELNGLRLVMARSIEDVVGLEELGEMRLASGQAMHVLLLSWSMLNRKRWKGLANSWRQLRFDHVLFPLACKVLTSANWREAVSALRTLESMLFEDYGGSWSSGAIWVGGGFSVNIEGEAEPLIDSEMRVLMDCCESLDLMAD
jgi:predicted nucleotidyltransferase